MNILICGDSFAANYNAAGVLEYPGWPQILSKNHNITNLAQAGCSQYKIYLQIQKAQLSTFDRVIIFHTSPYRIYIKDHPYLKNTQLHYASDLIYNDIENQSPFEDQQLLVKFFKKYFDLEHAEFIHQLIYEKIVAIMSTVPTFHAGINLPNLTLDTSNIFKKHRGNVNHFDKVGNQIIAQNISNWINCV